MVQPGQTGTEEGDGLACLPLVVSPSLTGEIGFRRNETVTYRAYRRDAGLLGEGIMFHRSERLFLRPAWPEDWEAIYQGICDEGVAFNLARAPWPYEPAHARAFAALPQDTYLPNFMVTIPGIGLIGSAGLGIDEATGCVHLGYWIGRKYWGQGYATEAARSVLSVAKSIGHKRMTASHFIDNPASGKVLRKAGFRPTGQIRPGHSVARGRHDPVACFELEFESESDVGPSEMRQAA